MFCRVILVCFGFVYAFALFVYLTGTYGWFGQQPDPLSGIFLIPLGLPWNLIDAPETIMPTLGIGAPLINFALIFLLCRVQSSRSRR